MKRIPQDIKTKMIQESIDTVAKTYGTAEIFPCGNKLTLDDCFTIDDNNIIFWYNIPYGIGYTTKIMTHPIPKIKRKLI